MPKSLNVENIFGASDIFFEGAGIPLPHEPSLLFGLEPQGVGTGTCESLRSYVMRLAHEHRVPVLTLVRDVLVEQLKSEKTTWLGRKSNIRSNLLAEKKGFLTMGDVTSALIHALNDATTVSSLKYCTLQPIKEQINPSRLLAEYNRHCRLCYEECIENDKLMYEPLIWNIKCVNVCHIHGVNLNPSECGRPEDQHLPSFKRKLLPGVCSRCGSVGYKCRQYPNKATNYEILKATHVAELIESLPIAADNYSSAKIIKSLGIIISSVAEGKQAIIARHAGIHKSVVHGIMNEHYLPSLDSLLRLCIAGGMSLVSVMKGVPTAVHAPVQYEKIISKLPLKPSCHERRDRLAQAVSSNPPESLTSISRELGLDATTLRRKFPELTDEIISRYRLFITEKSRQRHEEARKVGEAMIDSLVSKGLPLTHRNFQLLLNKPLMPKSVLYKELSQLSQQYR